MDVKTQTAGLPQSATIPGADQPGIDQTDIDQARGSKRDKAQIQSQDQNQSQDQDNGGLLGLVRFVILVVLFVMALRIFVIAPFSIPTQSMLPRLWNGDTLIATKWPYGYSRNSLPFDLPLPQGRIFAQQPERGDIVIFKHPVSGEDYIKRVIGLPGDTIALTSGQVILNGAMVPRTPGTVFEVPVSSNTDCQAGMPGVDAIGLPICRYQTFRERLPSGVEYDVLDLGYTAMDEFPAVRVPEGKMFVLGDHRDKSMDSRFEAMAGLGVGIVPQDNLVGRASYIVWSTDGSAQWVKPWTWFSATRWDRIGTSLSSVSVP